ncbi:hypothetical protein TRIUR3_26664 [Triticum urartu]|uniref:Uncharacterized protein n=1 Tax=Triticum urartu TaxID=4572 RepID=M7Z3N0_TRIUA|nr:hypothetical protein TRIUR3_26664 [Triticum urartu]
MAHLDAAFSPLRAAGPRCVARLGLWRALVRGKRRGGGGEKIGGPAPHVKPLQAQVGVLALMRTLEQEKIVPPVARERMHALLTCGGVQERLAAEGKCLVPTNLVEAMAEDKAVRSNAPLIRDLTRFSESLPEQ